MQQLDLFNAKEKPAEIKQNQVNEIAEKNGRHDVEVIIDFAGEDFATEIKEISIAPEVKKEKQSLRSKRGRKSYKEMDSDLILVEVPDDEELYKKQYYSISEVAQWFHVNASLLRFWESEFTILKPRKNRKGDRLFRPEDVKNLQVIYHLLRQRKFSIEGAKNYLKENKKKVDQDLQIINSLTKLRAFLLEMKANLSV